MKKNPKKNADAFFCSLCVGKPGDRNAAFRTNKKPFKPNIFTLKILSTKKKAPRAKKHREFLFIFTLKMLI